MKRVRGMTGRHFVTLMAASACAMVTPAALAGFTPITPSGPDTHESILESIYGGDFSASGTHDYTNGSITAIRVQDYGGTGSLNMDGTNKGTADDQVWSDGISDADVEVKVAGDDHNMDWYDNGGGGHQTLFPGTPDTPGDTVDDVTLSSDFEWVLSTSEGNEVSSDQTNGATGFSDNVSSGKDMMVTYFIDGLDYPTWLVFWEDRLPGQAANDGDYNDLVVEVQMVPLPAPLALAGLGLAGVFAGRRRLRRMVSG